MCEIRAIMNDKEEDADAEEPRVRTSLPSLPGSPAEPTLDV